MEFETVIGLEVHAQMKTKSKIFCGCSTEFGAPPNTHTCPVCLGMPGSLPVLNKQVVENGIKLALATDSTINKENRFARKNYFYPDLPKGYQISQFELPIAEHGQLEIEVDGQKKTIGITRAHMEEDAGKLVHDDLEPNSYVDLNRTGTPLLEIVSEPDLRSPEEAVAYLKKLHGIVRYLDICDGNMQEGSFRCDANISLRPKGQEEFGTRTELKNMNSFRNVQLALEYEERRQRDVLLDGGSVTQATLLWNPDANRTEAMRGKEEAHDYRYFPDPDLVPVQIDEDWIERVQGELPELAGERKQRFMDDMGLPEDVAATLTSSRDLADFFEQVCTEYNNPKKVSNFITTELLREYSPEQINDCPVSAPQLAALLQMVEKNTISGKIAKTVFAEMLESGDDPEKIVKDKGLVQMSDEGELVAIVREIIDANPEQAQQFRDGKTKVMGFFVGQLMQKTKGKANPQMANKLFAQELS
ncbi:MAG: Asp-tRNA(Asn)/Glu-tRNA(Gln) amidotransferase subunit GatB [Candidatus Electrothrix aestuarii]|uniref:Aspartyl/glutamyl-tRNA(Asn/Gln) amidotransferase subunit B n=1 Tax=Candidatus Electrothrix aestuarii TaxID=3062594 RepID=A0AAU8LX38_9BACT|nr:Asp-tRNA(Asn)/Glu-tRNA(Gln) amidotransferase subunit GatB [Candidatus Electrothrix aestuarii]